MWQFPLPSLPPLLRNVGLDAFGTNAAALDGLKQAPLSWRLRLLVNASKLRLASEI